MSEKIFGGGETTMIYQEEPVTPVSEGGEESSAEAPMEVPAEGGETAGGEEGGTEDMTETPAEGGLEGTA